MTGVGTVALDRPLCADCTALSDDRGRSSLHRIVNTMSCCVLTLPVYC